MKNGTTAYRKLKRLCYSYTWSCGSSEERTFFCTWLVPWKLRSILSILSIDFPSCSVLFYYFIDHRSLLCIHFSVLFHQKVPSVNPSLNYFVFGDFGVHHKNWLIYVSETYTSLTMFFLLSTFLLGSVYSTAQSSSSGLNSSFWP